MSKKRGQVTIFIIAAIVIIAIVAIAFYVRRARVEEIEKLFTQ